LQALCASKLKGITQPASKVQQQQQDDSHLIGCLLYCCCCVQGMPIDSSVAELLTAQLFVLVQEAPEPIYFYINSTGIAVSTSSSNGSNSSTASCGQQWPGQQRWQQKQKQAQLTCPVPHQQQLCNSTRYPA